MRHEQEAQPEPAAGDSASTDDAMRALVTRLGRPHRSGGRVIERAALLAAGTDFRAAMSWIEAHGGEPEAAVAPRGMRGLHSARTDVADPMPLRFILPPAALS